MCHVLQNTLFLMKITVFWDVMSYSLTEICQHYGELAVCLYCQGRWGNGRWQTFHPSSSSHYILPWRYRQLACDMGKSHHTPSPSQLLSLCQIEVSMVVAVKNTASWEVMPCSLVSLVQPTLFLWKVGTFVWGYMGSHPRSLYYSVMSVKISLRTSVCVIYWYIAVSIFIVTFV